MVALDGTAAHTITAMSMCMMIHDESVVCTCSGAYMRVEIGNENLVVCLSEYLPLRNVYIHVIKVEPEGFDPLFREEITSRHLFWFQNSNVV